MTVAYASPLSPTAADCRDSSHCALTHFACVCACAPARPRMQCELSRQCATVGDCGTALGPIIRDAGQATSTRQFVRGIQFTRYVYCSARVQLLAEPHHLPSAAVRASICTNRIIGCSRFSKLTLGCKFSISTKRRMERTSQQSPPGTVSCTSNSGTCPASSPTPTTPA